MKPVMMLGANDPEMIAVRTLCAACGVKTIEATSGGRPVTPSTAYTADAVEVDQEDLVCVECAIPGWSAVAACDHHRPNDPGFGLPPDRFLEASSLGQVISFLAASGLLTGWMPDQWEQTLAPGTFRFSSSRWYVGGANGDAFAVPSAMTVVAACDHCLAHAWAGKCPGVKPSDVAAHRAECASTRPYDAKYPGEYHDDLRRAQDLFAITPRIDLDPWDEQTGYYESDWDPCRVFDLRACAHIPELPDAACSVQAAYVARVTDRDGRTKHVLGGAATPAIVRAFMQSWAPSQGLTGIYGDPARGFAGGYLPS